MKIRVKRKVYNTETAKLVIELPNGFLGYRKKNGELFFLLDGKIGVCNEDYFHAAACNQITDEEFYKCLNTRKTKKKEINAK
jgi:hypothetical protein